MISTRVLIYSQSPHARSQGGVRRFRLGRAARQQRHRAHLRVTRYDANLQFTRPSPFARRRFSISHMCVLYPRSGALLGPPEQLFGMHRADVARHIRGLAFPKRPQYPTPSAQQQRFAFDVVCSPHWFWGAPLALQRLAAQSLHSRRVFAQWHDAAQVCLQDPIVLALSLSRSTRISKYSCGSAIS